MIEKDANSTEYRGYSLVISERSPGWCVHIFPGRHGLRHTHPDHVFSSTKEEALAKARATIDSQLLGCDMVGFRVRHDQGGLFQLSEETVVEKTFLPYLLDQTKLDMIELRSMPKCGLIAPNKARWPHDTPYPSD